MFLGVPVIPFIINVGIAVILVFYINLFLVPVSVATHLFLQHLAKKDELIFDNIFLWSRTKLMCLKNSRTLDSSVVVTHGAASSSHKQI